MKKPFQILLSLSLLLCTVLFLAGCASSTQTKSLDVSLGEYEQYIRWSQWEGAVSLIAPEYLAEHPITRLDMDRLRLFRVTQYLLRSTVPDTTGTAVQQVVEIRLFNRSQGVERSLIDEQLWRYDAERKLWLLHSGLPDVTQAR